MTAVEPTTKTRRDMLCGLVVALVAPGALVAACSSSEGGEDTGGDSGGGTGNGGGGGATPLADIPDGGGLIVDGPDGNKVLLVRTGNEVKAYNAACTHQGTIVNPPENGKIVCPNHGSEFDPSTGDATKGPATSPLSEQTVTVEGDQVTLT